VERYDKDCIPPDYRNNSLHYIQTSEINKTCTMTINVSPISLLDVLKEIWLLSFICVCLLLI
jgi:hypothetical protein